MGGGGVNRHMKSIVFRKTERGQMGREEVGGGGGGERRREREVWRSKVGWFLIRSQLPCR